MKTTEEDEWKGACRTTEVVFTFLQVLGAPGAPIAFDIRPLVFIVPSEDTPRGKYTIIT